MREILTARLLLRPPLASDAGRIAGFTSDFDVARMTTRIPHPNPVPSVLAWLASLGTSGEQAYVATRDGDLIGLCSHTNHRDPAKGELGYWIGKPHWGQGYATEMSRALIRHVFATTAMHAIPISHFIDNPASARVIAKCGFVPAGRRKLSCVSRGTEVTALTYVVGKQSDKADATVTLSRAALDAVTLRQTTFPEAVMAGRIKLEGNPSKLVELLGMLDTFNPMFEIVEPKRAGP